MSRKQGGQEKRDSRQSFQLGVRLALPVLPSACPQAVPKFYRRYSHTPEPHTHTLPPPQLRASPQPLKPASRPGELCSARPAGPFQSGGAQAPLPGASPSLGGPQKTHTLGPCPSLDRYWSPLHQLTLSRLTLGLAQWGQPFKEAWVAAVDRCAFFLSKRHPHTEPPRNKSLTEGQGPALPLTSHLSLSSASRAQGFSPTLSTHHQERALHPALAIPPTLCSPTAEEGSFPVQLLKALVPHPAPWISFWGRGPRGGLLPSITPV